MTQTEQIADLYNKVVLLAAAVTSLTGRVNGCSSDVQMASLTMEENYSAINAKLDALQATVTSLADSLPPA